MRLALVAATASILATGAFAADEARFRLERTDTGFVRMDTLTGDMTYCVEKESALDCRTAAGAAIASDAVAELEKRLAAVEERLATVEKAPAIAALPSDEEVDRALGYMERMMRSFMGVARDFEREFGDESRKAPDRT